MLRKLTRTAATGCILCFAVHSHAQPSTLPVHVTVLPSLSCTDSTAFYARIRARTDRCNQGEAGQSALRLVARGKRSAIGILGVLEVHEPNRDSEREVTGSSCEDVVDALSLIAAVIIDPRLMASPPAVPAVDEAPAPTPPSIPVLLPLPISLADSPKQALEPKSISLARWTAGIGLGFGALSGVEPRISVTPFLQLSLRSKHLWMAPSLRLIAATGPSQSVGRNNGQATFDFWQMRLEPCLQLFHNPTFAFHGCSFGALGKLKGEGQNTLEPATEQRSLFHLGISTYGSFIIGEMGELQLAAGLAKAILTPRFYFAPNETAFKVPDYSVFVQLSAHLFFL